jgi:hypothetical protein
MMMIAGYSSPFVPEKAGAGMNGGERRELGLLPLPIGERVGVRGVEAYRETLTPHPIPLPMGEGAERVRGSSSVLTAVEQEAVVL